MFTYSVTCTNTRLHIAGKWKPNVSLCVKELDLVNHIAAIPVLRDPAHQEGHPVQVIRSSCHVATLQYTVRVRSQLIYLAPPGVVGWTQGEEQVYLAPPGVVGWTQGEEVYLAPLVWWGGPRERSWYTWHHLVWWGGPRERSWYIWHHLV